MKLWSVYVVTVGVFVPLVFSLFLFLFSSFWIVSESTQSKRSLLKMHALAVLQTFVGLNLLPWRD